MTLEQELEIRYNKGVKDGAEAAKRAFAKKLREDGVPVEKIARSFGLSEEEIKAL